MTWEGRLVTSFAVELFSKKEGAITGKESRMPVSATTIFSLSHSVDVLIALRTEAEEPMGERFLSQIDIDSIIGFIITICDLEKVLGLSVPLLSHP